jgi:glycosyltransferase involved in cell wall biosynthesis
MSPAAPVPFAVEIHPPEWRFPAGATWIAGWILPAPPAGAVTDLRARLDDRVFLGLFGLPRAEIETPRLGRAGPPYAGFSFLLRPHRGARRLRLEYRDAAGRWREFFSTPVVVADDAPAAPAPAPPAAGFAELLLTLLRRHAHAPERPWGELARDVAASAVAEPLDCLPNPPFHGALEGPTETGRLRYSRLEVHGWLAHRTTRITRLTALADDVHETVLLHGLPREGVGQVFADLPGGDRSQFLGRVDLPPGHPQPSLLKVFADLADGTRHLVFARRFAPRVLQGPDVPLPASLGRWGFWRAAWALRHALGRSGAAPAWTDLRPALADAWRTCANDAPPRASRARARPLPDPRRPAPALRVLILSHNLNFEGAPWFILEYARHLAAQPGWQVRFASPADGPLRGRVEAAGLPLEIVDASEINAARSRPEFDAAVARLAARLDWSGVDLVVANTLVCFWGVQLARHAGRPALLYIHESAPVRRFLSAPLAPALHPIAEESFGAAARVGFIAAASLPVYAHHERRDNFRLLPSWIDVAGIRRFAAENPRDDLRRRHGQPADAFIFANIGSVCERKGQHVFVRAVAHLLSALPPGAPPLRFLLVGARAGVYLDALRHDIALLGLTDVELVEEVPNTYPFYRLADAFVCSSFEEAFPRVLMEAAAFSLPIVSTNVSGIPELLAPGDAWLVPAGSPEALAEAMKQALLARRAGDDSRARRAHATVAARFAAENSLPLHRALAQEACPRPAR